MLQGYHKNIISLLEGFGYRVDVWASDKSPFSDSYIRHVILRFDAEASVTEKDNMLFVTMPFTMYVTSDCDYSDILRSFRVSALNINHKTIGRDFGIDRPAMYDRLRVNYQSLMSNLEECQTC